MSTQFFNACSHDQRDKSKTLNIASQSEVQNKQYISATCFASKETKSRCFMIPFAVADIKKNYLGRLFFEKYSQNINIQVFTKTIKHSFNDQPTIGFFNKII